MFFSKFVSSGLLLGALFLTACDSKTATTESSPSTAPSLAASTASAAPTGKTQSGMVAEVDGIHLQQKPEKAADETHLDLFVQTSDSHSSITDAKVVAIVQSPDGKEQSIPMKYAAADKHYTGVVPGKAAGQYQVKVTAEVKGKPVAGRFSFSR